LSERAAEAEDARADDAAPRVREHRHPDRLVPRRAECFRALPHLPRNDRDHLPAHGRDDRQDHDREDHTGGKEIPSVRIPAAEDVEQEPQQRDQSHGEQRRRAAEQPVSETAASPARASGRLGGPGPLGSRYPIAHTDDGVIVWPWYFTWESCWSACCAMSGG